MGQTTELMEEEVEKEEEIQRQAKKKGLLEKQVELGA